MSSSNELMRTEELEARFAVLLFRLHQSINLLDLNLGLSIRFMENSQDFSESHAWLAKSNLAGKIERFLRLTSNSEKHVDDLAAWSEVVRKARCDRNLFAHAYWVLLTPDVGTPIHMKVHPWIESDDGFPKKMSLKDFELFVSDVEKAHEMFARFRRKLRV